MMNEFGVPMNDAERNMLPNPGKAFLQEQLATSGMEMRLEPTTAILIGAGVSAVGGFIGGGMAADAAAEQAEAQNKATHARYQYDLNMWDMKKSQLQAERQEAVDGIMTAARNEGKIRAYKDAANEEQYHYSLRIRNNQQAANEAAFTRSEDIYFDTTDLNSLSAKGAMDSRIIQLEESKDEQAFDRNESWIEALQAEGRLRAKGVSGRSTGKAIQTTYADYGRQMEMLNASDDSMGRNTRGVLEEIIRDKTSADLTAWASKMLDPGELPMPIKAAPIPIPELSLPRALSAYDFGPQPVMGAMASPSAAANAVWGQTITSIAGSVGSATSAYAGAGGFGDGSDIELKENIEYISQSPSGLNIYEWNYKGEPTTNRYRGVMAQDLLAKGHSDAVFEGENGYLAVDYSKLDVNMQRV